MYPILVERHFGEERVDRARTDLEYGKKKVVIL